MRRPKRRRAWRFGRRAESLAAWWLRLKGYRILARDFRVPVGEINLIARRGTILAFVEVKARKTAEAAPDALQPRQQRRIARAAGAFLQQRPALASQRLRFDVIWIVPGRLPCHISDAWRADSQHLA